MSFDIGFMLRSIPILAEELTTTLALAVPAIVLSAMWGVVVVSGLLSAAMDKLREVWNET